MALTTLSPPEQGQLVSVRQRRYVVTDVAKSTLPDRPLLATGNGAQHQRKGLLNGGDGT